MGKFKLLWVCFGKRKLETPQGRRNRVGQSGKETWLPIGIWEPLLRFIGIGILRTWGIIHGKASLSGSVYKMRQGWQRWRPSTTGPSCLNMGLSHLTYPWHQPPLFSISHKTHTHTHAHWQTIVQHRAELSVLTECCQCCLGLILMCICTYSNPPTQTKYMTFPFKFVP